MSKKTTIKSAETLEKEFWANIHFIERHDETRISYYRPSDKYQPTIIQDIRDKIAANHPVYFRNDICLINFNGKQYVVYPTKSGKPEGDGWQFLNNEQKAWCIEENRKIIETVKRLPEYACFLPY